MQPVSRTGLPIRDLSADDSRGKQIGEPDGPEQFTPHTVRHGRNHLRAILAGINVHAERPPTERRVHHSDYGRRHLPDVCIRRFQAGQFFERLLRHPCVRTIVVLGQALLILRGASVEEVVCAFCKGSRNDDRGLDPPTGQLAGI